MLKEKSGVSIYYQHLMTEKNWLKNEDAFFKEYGSKERDIIHMSIEEKISTSQVHKQDSSSNNEEATKILFSNFKMDECYSPRTN